MGNLTARETGLQLESRKVLILFILIVLYDGDLNVVTEESDSRMEENVTLMGTIRN